jgi:hypothetical protein
MMTREVVCVFGLLALLAACSESRRPKHPTPEEWCPSVLKADGSGLPVTCQRSGVAGTGNLRFSCTVENRYTARVDGIWYVMGIFTRGQDLAAIPDRYLHSMRVTFQPSEKKPLEFESDPVYASMLGGENLCFGVHVAPIKLNGAVVERANRW